MYSVLKWAIVIGVGLYLLSLLWVALKRLFLQGGVSRKQRKSDWKFASVNSTTGGARLPGLGWTFWAFMLGGGLLIWKVLHG